MTKSSSYSAVEVAAFAKHYGLTNLTEDHLARMQELAPIATDLGHGLPRPNHKTEAPAPSFNVIPIVRT